MKSLPKHWRSRTTQQGVTTLAITMMLLAILMVSALFAASMGLFEQRSNASEYRHKLAFQVAEAGLNQAAEYVKVNGGLMNSTAPDGWFNPVSLQWQPCSDAKPAAMQVDPCLAENDAARRALMYRYVGTGDGVLPLSGLIPTISSVGGTGLAGTKFASAYQTYVSICRLDTSVTPAVCSLTPPQEGSMTLTLVSRGSLTDESAEAIVKQSFGTYRSIGRGPDAPLIAAGTSIGLGNAQIVPNPSAIQPDQPGGNSGDTPLSIWAKGDADVTSGASFATCNYGEWSDNYGVKAPTAQERADGVCPGCTCNGLCPGFGLLTGAAGGCTSGAGTARLENKDILDVDGDKSDSEPQMLDSPYFPEDLFLYAFGVPSGSADSYLREEAQVIADCGTLDTTSAGLYWYQGPDDCKISLSVGSVRNPVVLVSDAPVALSKGTVQFFGIIYVRATAGTGDLIKATGSPQVYGSVILEGDAKMGGTPTLIYNKNVLNNILNSPSFLHLAPVAGSWSDDVPR
jgi:hypothetical protein